MQHKQRSYNEHKRFCIIHSQEQSFSAYIILGVLCGANAIPVVQRGS